MAGDYYAEIYVQTKWVFKSKVFAGVIVGGPVPTPKELKSLALTTSPEFK